MTIILGGNGYIGRAIQHHLNEIGEEFSVLSRREVNYCDRDALISAIRERRPRFLINAAGYTGKPNVDACELHKSDCLDGNAVLPGVVRDACEATKLTWGHVSSGCIYSGSRPDGAGFTEEDPPNFSFRTDNCSFYSGTKALGEEVLAGAENCYIWRLRIPFDHRDSSRNYLSKLLRYDRLLEAENSITHLGEFARACHECFTKNVPYGIYNITNPGAVTTRRVVELIQTYHTPDREFRYFESEAQFMRLAAQAPRSNCVLDSSKLQGVGIEMSPAVTLIEQCLKNWESDKVAAA